ncbi:hypothetical protein BABINDRAFT_160192 [Babjeviella inositovora NRRL Y-12698]|uniref:F-box domain-containing protein n=1 Tax=Babjeviella inositovora NRRL Y-12698 TaxID=984486 RepID=A0A1E3QY36_9ASCO|nr:uncharacterized protein BABINDRAFT_160192 [Babjeviella inositovora NRRL Y-12698]ODQ81977.1 hypothetical protein BABINDRAFT_160192 [Babjeviella inositovora NRRL Y-12698]
MEDHIPHETTSVVTPFLTKHLYDQSHIPSDNFDKFCYRHNPEIKCNKLTDHKKMKQIQRDLETLPLSDQEAISHVWSIFSAAPNPHRTLILQGILSQCCFPHLSFVSQEVVKLIKIDFISILPCEVALKILCHLDCASLCNAAQVSRKWKRLADDDRVWHHMCEQHIDKKCPQCGWGLPLMHMKRAREVPERKIEEIETQSEPIEQVETHIEQTGTQVELTEIQAEPRASQGERKRKMATDAPVKRAKPEVRKRPWKSVYSERFKVERNWRKGTYNIKTFRGHTDGVTCLQFNHKYLMTGSYDTTIKIWNVTSGKLLRTLSGHTKGVRALAFDEQKLITGGLDSVIKVWNYHTGQCISTYKGHADSVVSVDFHDKTIVSGSADHTIKVWHVDSRTCYTLRGHTDWVNSVKIHAASNTIFSASDDTTVRMWDMTSNRCLQVFGGMENRGHIGQVQCVIPFSYNDVFVEDHADSDSETDPVQSEVESTPPLNPLYPTHLLTSALDNTIKVWDVATGKCIRTQFGHLEGVWSIAADNFRIISGAHDRLIKVWDLQTGKCMNTFGAFSSVSSVALGDSAFVAGLENGDVKMYSFDDLST